MNPTPRAPRPSTHGFTLIELLTVIAIIGILAAILIPVVGRVRESAKRAKCISNVRQIALGLVNYANQDPKQLFPSNRNSGFWQWDLNRPVMQLITSQAGKDVLYCPAGQPVEEDQWSAAAMTRDFVKTSYVVTIPSQHMDWVPALRVDKVKAAYIGENNEQVPPSRQVLVADATIAAGDNFSNIFDGQRSNHLDGSKPTGGNLAFVDGHVEWRPFVKMQRRMGGAVDWYW